jgi:hypothetical protein
MQLPGDPSYRTWPLPYAAQRQEPGIDPTFPRGPEVDSRTLFRIRLHCQFANPGSQTAIMFLTEGFSERLHVAIQNPATDVTELIERTVKPEQFPEDWFPIFHFADLPPIFFELPLDYKYLRYKGQIVYINLNLLTEPINHAQIYYDYSRNFLSFLKLIEMRGLIRVKDLDFVQHWRLRPASAILLPEAEEYLQNWQELYLPIIPLTFSFLYARLNKERYYYQIGCSPVYIHFVALNWPDKLWLIDGSIELSMNNFEDYLRLNLIHTALLEAKGSVFRTNADQKLPEHSKPISEAFYYLDPTKKKIRSLLYPVNSIPPELF